MRTKRKGQALIELSVFGAIFLMIVGAMLAYGLRYNYMQRAQQLAYRRALKIASDPGRGSGTYTLMLDKHIPDPVNPFAVGYAAPIVGSASITRSGQLDAQGGWPNTADDLPSTVVDIQENQWNGKKDPLRRFVYRNAAYRMERPFNGAPFYDPSQVVKYQILYGSVDTPPGTGTGEDDMPVWAVRITDSCGGEVFDYASCYEQAARLVDKDLCKKHCKDVNSSGTYSCEVLCEGIPLNPPNADDPTYTEKNEKFGGPWYAANYVRHNKDATHPGTWYTFPVLDQLFHNLGSRAMGFQPETDAEQVRQSSVSRAETSGAGGSVVNQENVAWSDTNRRSFVYNDNINKGSGEEVKHADPMEYTDNITHDVYVSKVGGNYTETWTTGK